MKVYIHGYIQGAGTFSQMTFPNRKERFTHKETMQIIEALRGTFGGLDKNKIENIIREVIREMLQNK